jgi:hypothetical protein
MKSSPSIVKQCPGRSSKGLVVKAKNPAGMLASCLP